MLFFLLHTSPCLPTISFNNRSPSYPPSVIVVSPFFFCFAPFFFLLPPPHNYLLFLQNCGWWILRPVSTSLFILPVTVIFFPTPSSNTHFPLFPTSRSSFATHATPLALPFSYINRRSISGRQGLGNVCVPTTAASEGTPTHLTLPSLLLLLHTFLLSFMQVYHLYYLYTCLSTRVRPLDGLIISENGTSKR